MHIYAYVPITVEFCSNRSASLQFDKRVFLLFKESFRGSLDSLTRTHPIAYLGKFQRRFESSLFSVVASCSPECELSQMAPSSQTSTTPSDTKSSRADSKFRISASGSENIRKFKKKRFEHSNARVQMSRKFQHQNKSNI